MKKLEELVFERTDRGMQSGAERGHLDRRALILLKIIDGSTPVSIYQQNLKSFAVPALLKQLHESGMVQLSPGQEVEDVNSLFPASPADDASAGERHGESPLMMDEKGNGEDTASVNAEEQDEDVVVSEYLRKYAPGFGSGNDITLALSGNGKTQEEHN